jgi:hypothetical protein
MNNSDRYAASLCRAAPFIIAAPFSSVMIVGAFVLVEVTADITEGRVVHRHADALTQKREPA